jgi:hypothetical protein
MVKTNSAVGLTVSNILRSRFGSWRFRNAMLEVFRMNLQVRP